jgi:hypothetical protein
MPDITIDPGAVESARVSMLMVRDTLNGLHAQHESTASQIEGLLSEAASSVLDALNPLHALDPFGIWERWGFGGVAYSCSSTRGAVEGVRSTTEQVVERLCDAHRSQIAPALYDRSGELRRILGSALDSFWVITSMLEPVNMLRLIENPWLILEHFTNSRNALLRAFELAQDYIDYLIRLRIGEQELIEEIIRLLQTPGVEFGAGIVQDLTTLAGEIPHLPGPAGAALDAVGFIADVVEGGKYNARTISVDANTAAIAFIPVAGEVYAGISIASAVAKYTSWGLQGEEQFLHGKSRSQIDQLANEWSSVSDAIDPDPLAHDLGALASDLEGGYIQSRTLGMVDPGIGGFSNIPSDVITTAKDAGSLIWGIATAPPAQVLVDTGIVQTDVSARAAHAPGWIQGPLDFVAGPAKPAIDTVTNILSLGWL